MKLEDKIGRWLLVVVFYIILLPGLLIFKDGFPELTLSVINHLLGMSFTVLVIIFTVIRLPPIQSAKGIEPRISAIAGTFLLVFLVVLPRNTPPQWVEVLSLGFISIGIIFSIISLFWLGRSFSIMATARKLVTGGPYNIVRHPLYLGEAVTVIGVTMSHYSVFAIFLGAAQIAFQFRRMRNEELVLRDTFTEYVDYASKVPMIIPGSRTVNRP